MNSMWGRFIGLYSLLHAMPIYVQATFYVADDYSGSEFFNKWQFYGNYDNLTSGDIVYADRDTAISQKLVYNQPNGNAVLRVDNFTNVLYNEKRNSVRLESQATYGVGSVLILDAVHMPFGCSVWPSFWTHGATWPQDGEIDIVEAVNNMGNNQMALHSNNGCFQTAAAQSGLSAPAASNCSTDAGCVTTETKPNSFGAGFAQAGGGVFATQFDISGIYIWFWSRNDVPASIQQSTSTSPIELTDWGVPSASYPASGCDIATYFQAQTLTLTITLCGIWAGLTDVYSQTCTLSSPTSTCYLDNVIGPGSPKYDNAYFEIQYIRAYSPTPPSTSSSTISTPGPTSTGPQGGSSTVQDSSGAIPMRISGLAHIFTLVLTSATILLRLLPL